MIVKYLIPLLLTVKMACFPECVPDEYDEASFDSDPPLTEPCTDYGYTTKHRIHKQLNQCVVVGYQGPQCGIVEAYFLDHDGIFGKCICSRPEIAYGNGTCQYLRNSQGPCHAGQIWRYSEDHLEATCQPSPCGAWVIDDDIVDLIKREGDGKCYIENTRGPCGEGEKLVLAGKETAECVDASEFNSSGTFENSPLLLLPPPRPSSTSLPVFPAPINVTETVFGFDTLNMSHRRLNLRFGDSDSESCDREVSGGVPGNTGCPQGTIRNPSSEACVEDKTEIAAALCSSGKPRHPTLGCS